MVHASGSGTASVEYIINIPERIHDLCIYRVPPKLRQVNPKAYTPRHISIGPFHHGEPQFKAMEELKKRYDLEFRKRIKSDRPFHVFNAYIGNNDIWNCYADISMPDKKEFVGMIELDAVFIMEFLLRLRDRVHYKDDDYVMSKPWLIEGICLDLILLENQLPIKVLNELYTFLDEEESSTFLDLACKYGFLKPPSIKFSETKPNLVCKCFCRATENPKPKNQCQHERTTNAKHFTDLLRCFYIPSNLNVDASDDSDYVISYSATKLRDSGISFKAVRERYLLDVNFKNHSYIFWLFSFVTCFKITKARLELPKLIIDDGIECKLRNLIALEQCHYPDKSYICNYVSLIDGLIETKGDVDFLLEQKVIVNYLGSNDAVAKLVNSLGSELTISSSCYKAKIREINAHYENPFNQTMATIRRVYFKDLRRTSSTIVGLAILAFTSFGYSLK
ncbi:hypothetical protein O6P43_017334 [Quillaja saponaria]|uniref:Uncharacterized protein n=1 Tax=Quillaja saponaria TaxID=32244 RepID=A0AAD7PP89_QUISA|nr:hypothetical protein O6P43_017320 [Quillaja saponaria]KAJ7962057.1 hypothetical protein O6P43_017334 [Quillaja saponaria]